jgi:hypothetical protein
MSREQTIKDRVMSLLWDDNRPELARCQYDIVVSQATRRLSKDGRELYFDALEKMCEESAKRGADLGRKYDEFTAAMERATKEVRAHGP